ncbi:MAG: TlpA family protein disulfide reductase [Actinomycetota bacterium]|nr:TlpA family protein disulfide reductase [Actinomycetota bacterium]
MLRVAFLLLTAVVLVFGITVGLRQAREATAPESVAAPAFDLADARRQLRGSPPELARLHAQSNQTVEGGPVAFRRRLGELRGHPVVINKWADWCGPCRLEAPHLQTVATRYGRRVAFLGIDFKDSRKGAAHFQRVFPLPFPSYWDSDGEVTNALGDHVGASLAGSTPYTIFLDRSGKLAYLHPGQYRSEEDLAADVKRYLKP